MIYCVALCRNANARPTQQRNNLGRAIALSRARDALTKNGVLSAKEIADRTEGKPTQRVELGTEDGFEVKVCFEMPLPLKPQPQLAEKPPIDLLPEKSEDAPTETE